MSIDEHQTDPLDGLAETLDHAAAAMVAQATHGLSPATLVQAWSDWALHLAISPGRQLQLATKLGRKYMRLADYAARRAGDGRARRERPGVDLNPLEIREARAAVPERQGEEVGQARPRVLFWLRWSC